MLHLINGICERSHLQMCDVCGDEASLTDEVRSFLVSCGNRSVTKGVLHRTTFDNLHQNRPYRVYIVPLVKVSTSGEVRNVSIRTLLARPDTPKNLRLLSRSTQSLTFGWDQSFEDADNGPSDSYEVTLRKGSSIVKSITSKTEYTFQDLEMCTEYNVLLYGMNVAGRSDIGEELSNHTFAPSLGEVEVKEVSSEPLDHRGLSWRYLGGDTCPKSYRVRYRNKYMNKERYEVTSGTSTLLTSLDRNMVYIVEVMAQTTLDTVDGRKEGRYSPGKEFYTGTVRPEIYGIEKDLTSRGMRLNVSWSFNTSNDGSVFEFILLMKNASDLCISTTHFVCRSCPPPYIWENLNESNKSKREEILKCSPPQEVVFTKDNNSLHRLFEMEVPISNISLEIYSINLVGVHNVYGGNTAYDIPANTSKSSAASIVMVSFLLLFLIIFLVLLLKFRHQPKFLYNILFKNPTSNGIPNKRPIPPASTIEVSNIEEPYKNKKDQKTPNSKTSRNSDHLETKESLPLLEPKRRSNGVTLKDFPRHYEKMTSNKNEPLIQEYKKLTAECKKMESDLGLTVNVGKSPENTKKNRFVNILPFDQTRVIIEGKANDYTNANYIPFLADETSYEYIASQGPIEDSINDFWQMIWRQNVNCIVMLTRIMEDNKFKCLQYWPDNIGEEQTYGNKGEITVTLQEETELESHIERVLVVKEANGEEERTVVQLHMHTWFDHSAPNLEYFDKLLFRFHELTNETATNPYLIHCSAGVGRTGTLICIDRIIKQLVNGFQEINIYDTVFTLRHYRNFMVQRQAQYIFIHDYIDHFLKKYMKTDDAEEVLYFNED